MSCAEAGDVLKSVRELFAAINRDPNLTEDAKRRMEELYLTELITPKARTLLETHCSDEFKEFDFRRKRI